MSHLAAESTDVLDSFQELKPVRVIFDENVADDSNVLLIECDRPGLQTLNLGGYATVLKSYGQLDVRYSRIQIIIADYTDPDDALRRLRNEVRPRHMLIGRPWLNGEMHPNCFCGTHYTDSFVEGGIDIDQPLDDDQILKVLELKNRLVGVDDITISDNQQTIMVDFNLVNGGTQCRAARVLRRLALAMQIELETSVKVLADDVDEGNSLSNHFGVPTLSVFRIIGGHHRL